MLGKCAKISFPSNKNKSKEILDLVIEDEAEDSPKVELGSLGISREVTTTFKWIRGDDSPLHFCQETSMV
jgi:hypothetical protein